MLSFLLFHSDRAEIEVSVDIYIYIYIRKYLVIKYILIHENGNLIYGRMNRIYENGNLIYGQVHIGIYIYGQRLL